MLISLHIKNFRSIVDTTISLDYAEGKAPNGYKEMDLLPFLETGYKYRVVPCLALYGANAGGKTNLIRAMDNLKKLLISGVKNAFDRNMLHPDCTSTQLEAVFCTDKGLFSYTVEYNREYIIKELLIDKTVNKTLFSVEKSQIVDAGNIKSDFYPLEKIKNILKVECSDADGNQIRTFLSVIGNRYIGLNTYVSSAASYLTSSVVIFPTNALMKMGFDLLDKSLNVPDTSLNSFAEIENFIQKMDFGIKKIIPNREKLQNDKDGNPVFNLDPVKGKPIGIFDTKNESFADYLHTYHDDVDGKEVIFNFNEESYGTRTAFGLICVMLTALENGNVVFIDELDRSIHSLVFCELVRLFKDERYNKKKAQLIFTAHNTDLLDAEILRVSEVGIVSKNLKKGTTLARLSDFDGIRNVSNFRKGYLNGEFSGIPFPYI